MNWENFLIIVIFRQHGLSPKEQAILLAKFPDENTVNDNNQVAEQSLSNDQLPSDAETVRRQMWNIYNKRFAPQLDREGFPDYNQRSKDKDAKFLAWLKNKYEELLEQKSSSNLAKNSYINKNSNNPFIPLNDVIIDKYLLYSREREIARVFETLNSGSSVALIGERKIGKSSLLQAIYQQAPSALLKPRKPIYLNLSLIDNDDDFYDELCTQIEITFENERQFTRELRRQQLLLLLDEVQKMTWGGFTRELRQKLRGFADGQANPPLRLVIAASEHLDILFPDSRDDPSPFQGVCIEEVIEPWNETIMRGFISSRLANTQVSFKEGEIIKFIRESGGNPNKLMLLCHRAYSQYVEGMR
ncbi:AAA family ATPase [Aliinostoc sp. HNIBRCY26]|uniref:ATP-binding protein n=1 Tax=Aliinostoc sp. HNIBRCY26 TaxID=3418997 RepID=UPI003D089746